MLFDPATHDEFNDDPVVVCHEAGHAVIWFSFGEKIDSIVFRRTLNGLIGTARISCHALEPAQTKSNAKFYVERLLAGESAGRQILPDIPKDRICSFGVSIKATDKYQDVVLRLKQKERELGLQSVCPAQRGKHWRVDQHCSGAVRRCQQGKTGGRVQEYRFRVGGESGTNQGA